MDIIRGTLDILFRKISPERIIDDFFKDDYNNKNIFSHEKINEKIFIRKAHNYNEFRHYSEDEIENIYRFVLQSIDKDSKGNKINKSIFNFLQHFACDVLVDSEMTPKYKYTNTLRWRMISHKLGQDLFTTAFYASRDVRAKKERKFFAWDTVIKSDNVRIHNMLKEGMAENHFHLKGSAPYFALSWISLMNRVEDRRSEFDNIQLRDKILDEEVNDLNEFLKTDMPMLVRKAALIRVFLFSLLKGEELVFANKFNGKFSNNMDDNNDKKYYRRLKLLLNDNDILVYRSSEIQGLIDYFRFENGYRFHSNTYDKGVPIDYCIPKNFTEKNQNPNIFFYGERWFQYAIIKRIFFGDKKILKYADLFYAYLLIKFKLRSEMIQVNNRVGFKNFANYQGRKTGFIKNEPILKDALYYTAVNETVGKQNIKSLEMRITPEKTKKELVEEICKIENILDRDISDLLQPSKSYKNEFEDEKDIKYINGRDNMFYVIHFPKKKDKNYSNKDRKFLNEFTCRHLKMRKTIKSYTLSIGKLRESMMNDIKKVKGIDSCANEIGCRPEIFSQAYRFLKNHAIRNSYEYLIKDHEVPKLRSTYHVGEDFLDVADGLRAIDEALLFLGISSGDRLGHALALGINAPEWYEFKRKLLVIEKQDYLDNIVWMLKKIIEYNIDNVHNLVSDLKIKYSRLFKEIYWEKNDENNHLISSYITYYDSMLLRGDDPYLYISGEFVLNEGISYWGRCKVNRSIDKENIIRNNTAMAKLYHRYHFDAEAKRKGSEKIEIVISDDYIRAVTQIQREMQREIMEKGIGIEMNPSSNYLIGTFRRYDKHPILNLYNLGLVGECEKIQECPQMFVSINTDDQGVFGTCLENEFVLMAIALEKAKDMNGNKMYKQAMIYDWLDRVRRMGLEQSFK